MLLHVGQKRYLLHLIHSLGAWLPLWRIEKLLGASSFPTFSSSVSLNIVQDKDGCLLKHLLMKDLVNHDNELAFCFKDDRKPLVSLED